MRSRPYDFHPHPVAWAVVAALAVSYVALCRRAGAGGPTRRQALCFFAGLVALALAVTWPVADVAAHWSLTALVLQRLLLMLAAAPLLLAGTPIAVTERLTRPVAVDRVVEVVTRPPVAVVLVTLIVFGTLLPPAVAAQASGSAAAGGLDALLLLAGLILWGPVIGGVPGASRPGPLGRAVYLFVQSVLPAFPSVLFILAQRPLYAVYAHAHGGIGASPLLDQQIAGVVAKVASLPVLWTAAWLALVRAHAVDRGVLQPEPLVWAEVERQLRRVERAERRRRGQPLPMK